MTIDDLNKMNGRCLADRAARLVMGWEEDKTPGIWKDLNGNYHVTNGITYRMSHDFFAPELSIEDAFKLQAEIERRGVGPVFGRNLWNLIFPGSQFVASKSWMPFAEEDLFKIANATPRQRTIAAILAVQPEVAT